MAEASGLNVLTLSPFEIHFSQTRIRHLGWLIFYPKSIEKHRLAGRVHKAFIHLLTPGSSFWKWNPQSVSNFVVYVCDNLSHDGFDDVSCLCLYHIDCFKMQVRFSRRPKLANCVGGSWGSATRNGLHECTRLPCCFASDDVFLSRAFKFQGLCESRRKTSTLTVRKPYCSCPLFRELKWQGVDGRSAGRDGVAWGLVWLQSCNFELNDRWRCKLRDENGAAKVDENGVELYSQEDGLLKPCKDGQNSQNSRWINTTFIVHVRSCSNSSAKARSVKSPEACNRSSRIGRTSVPRSDGLALTTVACGACSRDPVARFWKILMDAMLTFAEACCCKKVAQESAFATQVLWYAVTFEQCIADFAGQHVHTSHHFTASFLGKSFFLSALEILSQIALAKVYCEVFEISPTLAKTRELRKFDTRTCGSGT